MVGLVNRLLALLRTYISDVGFSGIAQGVKSISTVVAIGILHLTASITTVLLNYVRTKSSDLRLRATLSKEAVLARIQSSALNLDKSITRLSRTTKRVVGSITPWGDGNRGGRFY